MGRMSRQPSAVGRQRVPISRPALITTVSRPAQHRPDRPLPLLPGRLGPHPRIERPVLAGRRGTRPPTRHTPVREAGEARRAQRRGLHDVRAAHAARRGRPPGTASASRSPPRRRPPAGRRARGQLSAVIASSTSRVENAIASSAARTRCALRGAARQAEDGAAGLGLPVRRAETDEARARTRRRRCPRRSGPAAPSPRRWR